METELAKIVGKHSDYKICTECGYINFYENTECHACGFNHCSDKKSEILKYIDGEYKFYESEGYTEKEIDNIKIQV